MESPYSIPGDQPKKRGNDTTTMNTTFIIEAPYGHMDPVRVKNDIHH